MTNEIVFTLLIFLPSVFGFAGCVFPKVFLWLSSLLLLAYSTLAWLANRQELELTYRLVGNGGIEFSWDSYSFLLIFGSSVALLITFALFSSRFSHYFYQICMVLLTALMISFTTIDLVSLFIALELTGFCAFLLISDRNDQRSLFNAFQYLIGGGLAMLIYLIGVVQAFTFSGSFLLADLVKAPPTAICLIIAGLLTKAGVFLCGLWVPNIYSHANCQSSAILSGCVTCAGIAPIARLSQALEPIAESMVVVGVLSGVIAAIYAVFERESGRALGWSSVSRLGLAMLSPSYACLYAMQHGICKALLFSTLHTDDRQVGESIDSEHLPNTRPTKTSTSELLRVVVFCIASLSIMGFPLLAGFITKNLLKYDLPYQAGIIFTTSSLLTSTVYARLIYDRLRAYRNYLKQFPFSVGDFLDHIFYFPNIILIVSVAFLIGFSLRDGRLYSYDNIESAVLSALIGIILFVSVKGLQANEFIKPVTKTIDLIGAPFLVAALLLANLLYFKI